MNFWIGVAIGSYVTALVAVVAPWLERELRSSRLDRQLATDKRQEQRRRLRVVLGNAVSTPKPFRRLPGKGLA